MSIIDTIRHTYADHYRKHSSDSPDRSRISLLTRLRPIMASDLNVTLLDIGSGPQCLFNQFRSSRVPFSKQTQMNSIDVAEINPHLSKARRWGARHFTADGRYIPFGNEVFHIVLSNLALSFMGKRAYAEIRRVMRNGGSLLINVDHPSIELLRDYLASCNDLTPHQRTQLQVWNQLLRDGSIFTSEHEIDDVLNRNGFSVQAINVGEEPSFSLDSSYMHILKWWEVNAVAV